MNSLREFSHYVRDKRCILYGAGTIGLQTILHLELEKICISYIVDMDFEKKAHDFAGTYFEKYTVSSPYDLLYENKDEIAILVATSVNVIEEVNECLNGMGFVKEKDYFNYVDIQAEPTHIFDPFLGYGRRYHYGKEEIYGFACYGCPEAEYKIVALGGSTTDPTFMGIKSWPQLLYEMMPNKSQICVYNGGIVGYDSNRELLKLIRDVIPLKPDLVISYTGINEMQRLKTGDYPFLCYYLQNILNKLSLCSTDLPIGEMAFGTKCVSSPANNFLTNVKVMSAACDALKIKHFTFLQASLISPGKSYKPSEREKICKAIYMGNIKQEYENFFDEIDRANPFQDLIIDARDILRDSSDLFIDACHVTEEGNRLIAEGIFHNIKRAIEESGY